MDNSLKKFVINQEKTIKLAMELINKNGGFLLIAVDDHFKLTGSISDGDIRRALLDGIQIEDPVSSAMNEEVFKVDASEKIIAKNHDLTPVVNSSGVLVDIIFKDQIFKKETPVLIMAGGLGSRLGELTKDCPKPMLEVGGKPILERIINGFKEYGFSQFFISVNYKAEVIENYFKDGSQFDCHITYLKEDKRLGTAGALSLLPKELKTSVLVINGDILTSVNFDHFYKFHNNQNKKFTMCIREYEMQVPYGVIHIENDEAVSFNEKPTQRYNVNAGVYLISPELIKFVPKDKYLDMSSFIDTLLEKKIHPSCFYLEDSWVDIGHKKDLESVQTLYNKN